MKKYKYSVMSKDGFVLWKDYGSFQSAKKFINNSSHIRDELEIVRALIHGDGRRTYYRKRNGKWTLENIAIWGDKN